MRNQNAYRTGASSRSSAIDCSIPPIAKACGLCSPLSFPDLFRGSIVPMIRRLTVSAVDCRDKPGNDRIYKLFGPIPRFIAVLGEFVRNVLQQEQVALGRKAMIAALDQNEAHIRSIDRIV